MAEKQDNDEKQVMVVQNAKGRDLKAVTRIDKKGNLQTTDPVISNLSNLLNISTFDSGLEAFFKKFLEQAENPSYSGIFIMTENVLKQLIKHDFPLKEMEQYRIDPALELQNMQASDTKIEQNQEEASHFQPLDITKIDLQDLKLKGIKYEDLQPHLKAMSYGFKSPKLIEMNPEVAPGSRISTKGRVALEEQPDGSLRVIPFYYQSKPNLDDPLYNVLLDKETKLNLLNTYHAGKVLNLELTPGKPEPCYITLDKLTNTLEVLPVSEIGPIVKIKGVELTSGQQIDFAAGKKIFVEGMTSRDGTKYDAKIQIDASNRNFSFTEIDVTKYWRENQEIYRARKEGQRSQSEQTGSKQLFIPKRIYKAPIPEEAQQQWTAALHNPELRKDVKAFFIPNMEKDGKKFDRWVMPDYENGIMKTYKWNPTYNEKQDRSNVESKRQEPIRAGQTSVANQQSSIKNQTPYVPRLKHSNHKI